jgi:hypothetical protein
MAKRVRQVVEKRVLVCLFSTRFGGQEVLFEIVGHCPSGSLVFGAENEDAGTGCIVDVAVPPGVAIGVTICAICVPVNVSVPVGVPARGSVAVSIGC